MDYTSTALVKLAITATENADDTLFGSLVTAASRTIDRKMTGAPGNDASDYFEIEDVADEEIVGLVDVDGTLKCWPRKASVNSVSAMAYRTSPLMDWQSVTVADYVEIEKGAVRAYLALNRGTQYRVKISYNGGLSGDLDGLPADLVEAATVLVARFYHEAKSQLADSIGIAELGTLMYTKAWPVRVVAMLEPFKRVVPW